VFADDMWRFLPLPKFMVGRMPLMEDNEEHSIGGARPQKKIRRVGRTWGGRCR
jgi:hypothetical protein